MWPAWDRRADAVKKRAEQIIDLEFEQKDEQKDEQEYEQEGTEKKTEK